MYKRKINEFYFEREDGSNVIRIYRNGDPEAIASIKIDKDATSKDVDYEIMDWYSNQV